MTLPERRQDAIEHLRSQTALEHLEWFAEIDSTNQHARRMIIAGECPLPALLVADRQTAGRGRSDRAWWSPEGCLMLSLVIDATQMPPEPETWTQLSLVAGVAAAKAAESLVASRHNRSSSTTGVIQLKWPNDLYISGRKVAGILVEAIRLPTAGFAQPSSSESLRGLPRMAFVIGIGLNVSVDFSEAPQEVRQRACSLSSLTESSLTQSPLQVEDALVPVIEQLFEELASWRAGSQSWWHAWNDRNLLAGRSVHLRLAGAQELVGLCEGIDMAGRLLVHGTHGLHEIQSADIVGWN